MLRCNADLMDRDPVGIAAENPMTHGYDLPMSKPHIGSSSVMPADLAGDVSNEANRWPYLS